MSSFKIGDIVARKSYGQDLYFKITNIIEAEDGQGENTVEMKGLSYRILADAPESDIVLITDDKLKEYKRREEGMISRKNRSIQLARNPVKKNYYARTRSDLARKFEKPGTVLHLDGDEDYLDICLDEYEKLGLVAIGKFVPEQDQPAAVYDLLREHRPDILVLTGHDAVTKSAAGYGNISSYKNSKYYIEAVKAARRYEPDMDSLVIFAGACQSMYNEILKAGANFASSPNRVLIHTLDPVLVSEKIAMTDTSRFVSPKTVIESTITGSKGIGGFYTRGKYRDGFPMEDY